MPQLLRFEIQLMIYNVLKIYNVTKQLICNPSIIIINELSIVRIFAANWLQFETLMFPNSIVLMLRFVDGSWTRSEKTCYNSVSGNKIFIAILFSAK